MAHSGPIPERAQTPEEQIRLLLQLQAVDENARKLTEAQRALPVLLAKRVEDLGHLETAEAAIRERSSQAERRRRDAERVHEESHEKLAKSKGKLLGIKDNREYQAALTEIATLEERIDQQEEEILLLMEKLEGLQGESANLLRQVAETRSLLEEERKLRTAESARMDEELRASTSKRALLLQSLDRGLIERYEHVAPRSNGRALALLRDEICQGCSMRIPPQLALEVKRKEAVLGCPHCHRILFTEETGVGLA